MKNCVKLKHLRLPYRVWGSDELNRERGSGNVRDWDPSSPTQTSFGLVTQSFLTSVGKKDYVTSAKDVCIGGYH